MKPAIARYTTIINQEKRLGSEVVCYTAYVPVLGVATEGETADKAVQAIRKLVDFHLESLVEEGLEIPIESPKSLIKTFLAQLPATTKTNR